MGPNIFKKPRTPLPITIIGVMMVIVIGIAVRACEPDQKSMSNNGGELNISGKVAVYMLCKTHYRTSRIGRPMPITDAIAEGLTTSRDFFVNDPGPRSVTTSPVTGRDFSRSIDHA